MAWINKKVQRFVLLFLGIIVLVISFTNADSVGKSPTKVLVGVIRWDAWYDGQGGIVQRAVEKSLGPKKYHDRLPFFANVINETTVSIGNRSQAIMDQEISIATNSGIDYWAFVYYPKSDVMSSALTNYLNSQVDHKIGFSLVDSVGWGATHTNFQSKIDERLQLFSHYRYQKIYGSRPIYYMLPISSVHFSQYWNNDPTKLKLAIKYLRDKSIALGIGDPYIILMDRTDSHNLGVDAVSTYASQGGSINASHSQLSTHFKNFWASQARLGISAVPGVTVGWDPRPRIDNPTPWGSSGSAYYLPASPSEIVADINLAKNWASAYSKGKESTIIVYAWNEFDEGGWIAPTYKENTPQGDVSRINALKENFISQSRQQTTYLANGNYAITFGDSSMQFYRPDGSLYQARNKDKTFSVFNKDYSITNYSNIIQVTNGDTHFFDLLGKIVKVVFKDGSFKTIYGDSWLYYDVNATYVAREVPASDGSSRKYTPDGKLFEIKLASGQITVLNPANGTLIKIIETDGSYKVPWSDGWLYYSANKIYLFHEVVGLEGSYKRYNTLGKLYEAKSNLGIITIFNPDTGLVSKIIDRDGAYKVPWPDGWLYYSSQGVYLFHEVISPDNSYKRFNAAGKLYETKSDKGVITQLNPTTGAITKVIALDGSYKVPWPDGWLYYSSSKVYLFHEVSGIDGSYKRFNAAGKFYESKDFYGVIFKHNPDTGALLKVIALDGTYKVPWPDGWLYYNAGSTYLFHEVIAPDGSYKRYNAAGKLYESKDASGIITKYDPDTGAVIK